MSSRIALGTAQFGMSYGIANKSGQVNNNETAAILQYASIAGLDTLDTAMAYGDAEKKLGAIGISGWKVISKLPPIPENCPNITSWVLEKVKASISCLGVNELYGLLLHKPQQLLESRGSELYDVLNELKRIGIIKKIGVSIYDMDDLNELCTNYNIDIVQSPFNVLDHRLIESGWLESLKSQNIEVHVRSIFLQGLLLMKPTKRSKYFTKWNNLWNIWEEWLEDSNLTPLQACIRYVSKYIELNRIIVGVDNLEQFQDIIRNENGSIPDLPSELICNDIDLINPAKWIVSK